MSILRVRPDINSVVLLPTGEQITLKSDDAFDSDDPVVAQVCEATGCKVEDWFQSDAEAEVPAKRRRSVSVEAAAADPGRPSR